MAGPNTGHHIVVREGKFVGIVSELLDGNFVVLEIDQPVYPNKQAAMDAALNSGVKNEASTEWLHE